MIHGDRELSKLYAKVRGQGSLLSRPRSSSGLNLESRSYELLMVYIYPSPPLPQEPALPFTNHKASTRGHRSDYWITGPKKYFTLIVLFVFLVCVLISQ